MPTLVQLKEFLTAMGIPLAPDFVLEALLEADPNVQACLEAQGLSPAKILLVYLYLFSLLALPASYKLISSQTAPSGASQSFRYTNETDAFRNVRSLLYGLDKNGCTWGLIPDTGNAAGLWISTGGKCC